MGKMKEKKNEKDLGIKKATAITGGLIAKTEGVKVPTFKIIEDDQGCLKNVYGILHTGGKREVILVKDRRSIPKYRWKNLSSDQICAVKDFDTKRMPLLDTVLLDGVTKQQLDYLKREAFRHCPNNPLVFYGHIYKKPVPTVQAEIDFEKGANPLCC